MSAKRRGNSTRSVQSVAVAEARTNAVQAEAASERKVEERKKLVEMVRSVVKGHDDLWLKQKRTNDESRALYETKFWEVSGTGKNREMAYVETGDGARHIESMMSLLFSRTPSVEVSKDKRTMNRDPRPIQYVVNEWLKKQRCAIERAAKMALLYPCAFVRVSPCHDDDSLDPEDSFEAVAVAPWDVIVDHEAPEWKKMRYVGHRYSVSVAEAQRRWPEKVFNANTGKTSYRKQSQAQHQTLVDGMAYVQIVELYDLVNKTVLFWSQSYLSGAEIIESAPMPLRLPGTGKAMHPIIPLYFEYVPDQPMTGISQMQRVRGQLYEKNVTRTFQANATRRMSRQYLYNKDRLNTEDIAKITAGVDGAMIGIDGNESLTNLIAPVPQSGVPGDVEQYVGSIESDLSKGSIFASFTRGEATGSTATEVGVLAQYSSSAAGKMARDRDEMIESIANAYMAHLVLSDPEAGKVTDVEQDGVLVPVMADDFNARFRIQALDQAGTPVSKAIERNQFATMLPVLQTLGVPNDVLLAHLVRLNELPIEWTNSSRDAKAEEAAAALNMAQEQAAATVNADEAAAEQRGQEGAVLDEGGGAEMFSPEALRASVRQAPDGGGTNAMLADLLLKQRA